jgi:hypothetical protein
LHRLPPLCWKRRRDFQSNSKKADQAPRESTSTGSSTHLNARRRIHYHQRNSKPWVSSTSV